MTIKKFFKSLTLTGFIFGLLGWFYIVLNTEFHMYTLSRPLTHFLKYPREDTFGAICFAVALVCCFVYLLLRD